MEQIKLDIIGNANLTSAEIDTLFSMLPSFTSDSSIKGHVATEACYEDAAHALHERFPQLTFETAKYFVRFKDKEVLRVLIANGVGKDGGVTKEDLGKITSIGSDWFQNKTINTTEDIKDIPLSKNWPIDMFSGSSVKRCILGNQRLENYQFRGATIGFIYTEFDFTISDNQPWRFTNATTNAVFLPNFHAFHYEGSNIFSSLKCQILDIGPNCIEIYKMFIWGHEIDNTIFRSKTIPSGMGTATPWGRKKIFAPQDGLSSYVDSGLFGSNQLFAIGSPEWQTAMRTLAEQYAAEYANWSPEQIATADYSDPYIDYRIFGLEPPTD